VGGYLLGVLRPPVPWGAAASTALVKDAGGMGFGGLVGLRGGGGETHRAARTDWRSWRG